MIANPSPKSALSGGAVAPHRPIQDRLNDGALGFLKAICARSGLDALEGEVSRLMGVLERDLTDFERELGGLQHDLTLVGKSATHLLERGGKRLRPLLVVLASRLGKGFTDEALHLAVAVELVHSATLLHDDVVDLGTVRRGDPAARVLYGNAASIFAGDWLLVEGLRRVRRAGTRGALDRLLTVIEEMVVAEAVQLERRGRLDADEKAYFRIIDGKTAALFRWAMFAGASAGGLDPERVEALEHFGAELGIAFQAIDDALDLAGDPELTKKSLAVDLREGKVTYPILIGLERDAKGELRRALEEIIRDHAEDDELPEHLRTRVLQALERTGALDATVALARERVTRARAHLDTLPPSSTKALLEIIAEAMVQRTF